MIVYWSNSRQKLILDSSYIDEAERAAIQQALQDRHNKTRAAATLDITSRALHKLKKFGVD